MEIAVARDRLARAEHELGKRKPKIEKRERYDRGEQDLPYAPQGVNAEYQDLREQSVANYFTIAKSAPVQRLRADSIRTSMGEAVDTELWNVLQSNKFASRQSMIYESMLLHGRGIASCWPNLANRARPIIRPESMLLVHVEMDPGDPFTPLWAAKIYTEDEMSDAGTQLLLPRGALVALTRQKTVGIVYDADGMIRFERGGYAGTTDWKLVRDGTHEMKRVPFALYDYTIDGLGKPWSAMDALIPQQDAINTIRFNTLLAMQFSAFRQRIVTGFDPRVTDEQGNFLYERNPDGTPKVDQNGNAIPVLNTPGRVGVDRLLAFPGGDTKVFDLAESNLKNYIEVLESFLVQFFSTGQIPPQYLLSQMANLSGDALAGAESTLASLVKELQQSAGEGNVALAELAWHAAGNDGEFSPSAETVWADAEARSFAQIIDAVVKLISQGFPRQGAWLMIPGATPQKVQTWMDQAEDEAFSNRLALAARQFQDVTGPAVDVVDQTEITDAAAVGG
ncbi:phage portal protein [Microbacterium oleivorans]|uniref:phage portal protein n=1 Tax=Microbacterium oleivorans TaxID=273677 RepID=UPI0034174C3F